MQYLIVVAKYRNLHRKFNRRTNLKLADPYPDVGMVLFQTLC